MREWTIQRRRQAIKRADYRHDKKLFRLPAPFYRKPDMSIVPGPGAERIVLSYGSPGLMGFVHDSALVNVHIVRGWLVRRANTINGYYIEPGSAPWHTLSTIVLNPAEEGTHWARGWDDETFKSVCAATAMSA